MATITELQNILLELLAPERPQTLNSSQLTAAEWNTIEAKAREHRVLPLLHWALSRSGMTATLPATLTHAASHAFRSSTLRALQMQRELLIVGDRLRQGGIPYLALKGAYLAFAVYPQAGLRPLRDLDVLVPREQALKAHGILTAAGYTPAQPTMGDAAAWMHVHKHLSPLKSPTSNVAVELHVSLSMPSANNTTDDEGIWVRRISRDVAGQEISYLSATDLLLHLIGHAAYEHHFDNGPLTLSDIAFLLRREGIDWPLFWRMAQRRDWTHGAVLLLEMAQRYWGDLPVEYLPDQAAARAAARGMAPSCAALMLQAFERRGNQHLAAQLATQSLPQKLALLAHKLFPGREILAWKHPVTPGALPMLRSQGQRFLHLCLTRLPEVLSNYRHGSVRADTREMNALMRWLETP